MVALARRRREGAGGAPVLSPTSSCLTPLTCALELPPAADGNALDAWISAHIDW
ncbi:hypothetical protein [Streptomyces sp. McG3]|uniref:hypothetical protein n=1 Tax=Streptomyces sp. McG3 TaxID=2725483 RepID=UPI001BE5B19F|nr:hypothetical protein [Streptomyces sp. McG3]MBT2901544.1 hypothetical protein [Streptomyces sp. McG3]